ncbi:phenylacetate--CoA ligase family protein [Lacinutrix neustonica]|uniref:Phenylacetate--CoA ligase family protein n=1 Tax=Lacinutrix neustonica TaxID=2980107 RepID=A0A9E8SDD7_9FLAO|nr:phenylacetate--CoA ligase family protein [Lacinutrix neustonica]WAC01099.1 phenylacetate--CoA ligase family protein [Lacinutrix neustonica]
MSLFERSLKWKGFPIQEAKDLLKTINTLNSKALEASILKQREFIINYHLEHNSFYKSFASKANAQDWSSIPILSKSDLQQPLTNRLSQGFTKKNCLINNTSGSSRQPLSFAKDPFCHALTWAVFMDRYLWYNIDLNTSKQARFYGIPLNTVSYYKERIKDVLSNRFRFSVFDMSDAKLKENVATFSRTNFEYLYGYSNALALFGKYLAQEKIVLKTVCPSLKACIATSETLFEEDRELLEKAFGVPVINEYGCAELGLIAFQNHNGTWKINSHDLYVEVLDENGAVLPYGAEGRLVITSLFNKAHPFIRYDLGDIGTLSKKSTIQYPILESLAGRTNDVLRLPSGKTAAGFTMYYVTKTVIDDTSNVKEFMIEQMTLDTFKVSYVSRTAFSDTEKTKVIKALNQYLEPGLTVSFERKEALERSKSGKVKQFISYVT